MKIIFVFLVLDTVQAMIIELLLKFIMKKMNS